MTRRLPGGGAPLAESISISPTSVSLGAGDQQQLEAFAYYSSGETVDVTDSVDWSSSDESVATVSASGLVTAVGDGTATITASLGLVSAQATVVVSGEGDLFLVFRRTIAQPADGTDFFVTLPITLPSDSYSPDAEVIEGNASVGFSFPDAAPSDRTTTQFRVQTTGTLEDGDVIELTVLR